MLVNYISKIIKDYRISKGRQRALKYERKKLDRFNSQVITKGEVRELKRQWGRLGLKLYPDVYKVYKAINGFDPKYLSDDLFYPYIIGVLNPKKYSQALSHKAFYEIIFNAVKQPTTFCKRVRGVFYDRMSNVISESEAVEILTQNRPFILKPTIETSTGKNVVKVSELCDLQKIFDALGNDFIAQEVIEQSTQTSILNPTSLNTIRISSLYINGQFSIANIVVRMGVSGSVVDNLGAGGLMLGVRDDGTFYEYAYDSDYEKHYDNAGVVFKGLGFKNIDYIKSFIKELHVRYLPHMGFVGWDVALNKNDELVLIEVNLQWPSVQFTQLAVGRPVFAERTEEVIDFVMKYYA